uniref:G_PROTEIN_RECEP_F1_2 domain-containing protein n=1 Tax=Meloidogyne incognita TaxID=6306 RepID=A0A914NHU0_MELIC
MRRILISNVLFLYAIYALTSMVEAVINFIVLFTYSNPCDCLTQVWLVYLIRMPEYIYYLGSPLFHFAIMIERVLATVYVKIYEKQGKLFGVISTIIVWLLNLMFGLYIYITTQMDTDTFGHPMVYLILTTKYNSQILIYLNYILLFLVICVAIADYYLIVRNRKIKLNFFNSTTNYSLSKSYQSKQNILLMRIIFPLDFSYSFVFALFNALANFLRYNRDEYGPLVYVRTYEGITLLLCGGINWTFTSIKSLNYYTYS